MASAQEFVDALKKIATPARIANVSRFFHGESRFLGVLQGKVFPVAKQFAAMPLIEIDKLLSSPYYEARLGAVAIMDFQARDKKITPEHRKALYDLYIDRHDRIDNWDLVDRAAPFVVGGYLFDKSRVPLRKLAKSKNPWERRTAIVATYFFIRQNEIDDTFAIAALLVADKHELVQKAVGSWIREAGKRDEGRLVQFLDKHARTMSRVMLRYSVEKLEPGIRAKYVVK